MNWTELRRRGGSTFVEMVFGTAAAVGRAYPGAQALRSVERLRDIPYRPGGDSAHLLDVYRPKKPRGKLPVLLYIHGGAFRILSKDSHWLMGVQFASAGMLCVNISYRLAPKHPFPAALEDAAEALAWVLEHAESYGGDPSQIVIAGESAGANLTCALTVASCFERSEPVAKRIWSLGVIPTAIMPACGILQVTRPERFEGKVDSWLVMDRIRTVPKSYVPDWRTGDGSIPLADPLCVLESTERTNRPWPPTFIGCGDADPIADDSERLGRALSRRGREAHLEWYGKQPHAFQMMIWRDEAKRFWQDSLAFLGCHLESPLEDPVYGLSGGFGEKSSA
ncbi:MAG: alpha/beta hydrolase [Myxococcota bacterium]